jgi:uncharacterized protein
MDPNLRRQVRNFILQTLLVLIILVSAAWAAIIYFKPGPEGKIIIATGGAEGRYHELALTYKKELERFGVEVELRDKVEAFDVVKGMLSRYKTELNMKNFDESTADIEAGFVKGGFSASMRGRLSSERGQKWHQYQVEHLRSLGRLFYEPVWVFTRAAEPIKTLGELKTKKLMIGSTKSGGRGVIRALLKSNGIEKMGNRADGKPIEGGNTTYIDEDLPEDAAPLISGQVDAAMLVLPADSSKIQKLLRNPQIQLMDFATQADGYTTRFPALTKVILRRGAVEFNPETPPADITLLTTSAALVVRKELPNSLAALLTYAAIHNPKSGFDKNGDPILFYQAGQFPSSADPEFELATEAALVYKTNELPALLRGVALLDKQLGLPFWPAAFAHEHGTKTLLLAIPVLSILLPLMRLLPMAYNWSMRRRLLHWYRQLKVLENSIDNSPTHDHLAEKLAQLDRIEAAVAKIRMPLYLSDQLYDLRGHIDLVRQRLTPRPMVFREAAE